MTARASVARSAWLYVTLLSIGYMISRGLAKAGSRGPLRRLNFGLSTAAAMSTAHRPEDQLHDDETTDAASLGARHCATYGRREHGVSRIGCLASIVISVSVVGHPHRDLELISI
jgi:hypothetical protein